MIRKCDPHSSVGTVKGQIRQPQVPRSPTREHPPTRGANVETNPIEITPPTSCGQMTHPRSLPRVRNLSQPPPGTESGSGVALGRDEWKDPAHSAPCRAPKHPEIGVMGGGGGSWTCSGVVDGSPAEAESCRRSIRRANGGGRGVRRRRSSPAGPSRRAFSQPIGRICAPADHRPMRSRMRLMQRSHFWPNCRRRHPLAAATRLDTVIWGDGCSISACARAPAAKK
jgi:hypothetical protein